MVKGDGSVHLQLTYGKRRRIVAEVQPRWALTSASWVVAAWNHEGRPGLGDGIRRGGEAEQLTNITDQNIQGYTRGHRIFEKTAPRATPQNGTRSKERASRARAPPKPIVIDRYHFNGRNIQGYLRNDAYNALYLWDLDRQESRRS